MPANPPPGLGILELVTAPQPAGESIVARLRRRVETELASTDLGRTVIELLEGVLIRRFSRLSRQEVVPCFSSRTYGRRRSGKKHRRKGRLWPRGKSSATAWPAACRSSRSLSCWK